MDDLVVRNRKRIYALAGYTVINRPSGWHFKQMDYDDWRGPYASEMSVCLMIARALKKELVKRDGLPT